MGGRFKNGATVKGSWVGLQILTYMYDILPDVASHLHGGKTSISTSQPTIKVKCPSCSSLNEEKAKFCSECGQKMNPKICPKCNTEYDVGTKFCNECGTKLSQDN